MAMCSRDDRLVATVSAVLQPYQWRSFRPELLARAALGAKDRHELSGVLAGVPGAVVGEWDEPAPVDRDDPRVAPLVRFLTSHRWTELTLTALCRQLLALADGPWREQTTPGAAT